MNTNKRMSYRVTALLLTLSLFIIAACQKDPNSGTTNEQPSPAQVLSTEEQNSDSATPQEGEKDLRTEIVTNLKGYKEVKSLKIDGRSQDAGSASISPDGKYVIFETSDQSRKAGLARVIFDGDKTPNPILLFSERGAYEPRWSPVPVAD